MAKQRDHQKIAGAVINRSEPPFTSEVNPSDVKRRSAEIERRVDFNRSLNTIPEKIAQHKFFYRNHSVAILRDTFPNNCRLWSVDQYFPHAEKAPLYVENPRLPDEIEEAKQKQEVMKKAGHRFLILSPTDTEIDARSQLGEL